MQEAIDAYRHITVSKEFKELDRIRQKALHDEANALSNAERRGERKGRQEGIFDIAKNAVRMKMAVDDIIKLTGLTRDEVERLKQ